MKYWMVGLLLLVSMNGAQAQRSIVDDLKDHLGVCTALAAMVLELALVAKDSSLETDNDILTALKKEGISADLDMVAVVRGLAVAHEAGIIRSTMTERVTNCVETTYSRLFADE